MGLIQRAVEAEGVATIGITIVRKFTEQTRAPRSVFLEFPFGHPLGELGRLDQQERILDEAFKALYEIKEPGTIIDLPFKWKRWEP